MTEKATALLKQLAEDETLRAAVESAVDADAAWEVVRAHTDIAKDEFFDALSEMASNGNGDELSLDDLEAAAGGIIDVPCEPVVATPVDWRLICTLAPFSPDAQPVRFTMANPKIKLTISNPNAKLYAE